MEKKVNKKGGVRVTRNLHVADLQTETLAGFIAATVPLLQGPKLVPVSGF